jgi:hypothetical protein
VKGESLEPGNPRIRATQERIIAAAADRGIHLVPAQFHWDADRPQGRRRDPIAMDIEVGTKWVKAAWPRTALHIACSDKQTCGCVVIVRRIVGELD